MFSKRCLSEREFEIWLISWTIWNPRSTWGRWKIIWIRIWSSKSSPFSNRKVSWCWKISKLLQICFSTQLYFLIYLNKFISNRWLRTHRDYHRDFHWCFKTLCENHEWMGDSWLTMRYISRVFHSDKESLKWESRSLSIVGESLWFQNSWLKQSVARWIWISSHRVCNPLFPTRQYVLDLKCWKNC